MFLEFTGHSGAGKTTIAHAFHSKAQTWKTALPWCAHFAHPDYPKVTSKTRRALYALAHPILLRTGFVITRRRLRLVGVDRKFLRHLRNHVARIATSAYLRSRVNSRDGCTGAITDQGLFTFMRPGELPDIPDRCLPDVVVEIQAPSEIRVQRIIQRRNPMNLLQGRQRATRASHVALTLRGVKPERCRKLISDWSNDCCDPPLSSFDIEAAMEQARHARGSRRETSILVPSRNCGLRSQAARYHVDRSFEPRIETG